MNGTDINPLYERHKKVEAKRATENLIQKVANINAQDEKMNKQTENQDDDNNDQQP